jgi:predicted nucleotidyltransferase
VITDVLTLVAEYLLKAGIPYMVIGGQAVLQYGRPRFTQDIDITLGLLPSEMQKLLAALPANIFHPLPDNIEDFVRNTWVLPVEHCESKCRIDFIFSVTPFEREAIMNSREICVSGVPVRYISPEDLVVQKIIAGRPRDIEDVIGILNLQGKQFNRKKVEQDIGSLAEQAEIPEWPVRWLQLKKEQR